MRGATAASTRLIADKNGLIPLGGYPNCTEAYQGQFRGASLFVVGRGTPHERLFRKAQRHDAVRYAQPTPEHKALTVDHVHSTTMCAEAVIEVLGA